MYLVKFRDGWRFMKWNKENSKVYIVVGDCDI